MPTGKSENQSFSDMLQGRGVEMEYKAKWVDNAKKNHNSIAIETEN